MALPKLNDVPKYEITIPSTDKKVYFRPFLVKEQKVLLIALESQDEKQILQAVVDTIKACIYEDIEIDKLAIFDLEYIFLQIRGKSVGETADLIMKCRECNHENKVKVDLEEIKIKKGPDKKFVLNDQFTIEMKYPSYEIILREDMNTDSVVENIYNTVLLCMSCLYTKDDIIRFDEYTDEDKKEFMESLTSEQFDKIVTFVSNLPAIVYDLEYDCESCKHSNKETLRGIQDFLS